MILNKKGMILNKKGYGIIKTELTKEQKNELKNELSVKPLLNDFEKPKTYKVYRYNSTMYYVPKFWGIKHYGIPSIINENEGIDVCVKFEGNLQNHQEIYTKKLLNEIKDKGSCIACSATGSGKTVMALWLISQIKKRTLILVHKQFLMDQWVERIKTYLPNSSIGIIKQKQFEINNDVVVGMIQTITKREHDFESIGFCIVDETHHISSETFSKIPYKVGCKYNLGLSATPHRKDGLTKVIEWFFGCIIKNENSSNIDKPCVKFIKAIYTSNIIPVYRYNYKKNTNMLIVPNLETQIANDKGRTMQIIEEIIKQYKQNRKILVLSSRRNHCEEIKDMLPDVNCGLYLGGMSEKKLTETNLCNVILATYSMAHEGYDNPNLDTLIFATGKSDIEQACGRILRKKNANRPLIIDFTDTEFLKNQFYCRKQFYKKKDYEIINEIIEPKEPKEQISEENLFLKNF